MVASNHLEELRRDVLRRVARAFLLDENPGETVSKIPFILRPKNAESDRCCTYKDRAILRYRCMAAMGFLLEDDPDDSAPLTDYAALAWQRKNSLASFVISACDVACHGCVKARYFVTNICQGCVAHPCLGACRFGAIDLINGRSEIDVAKCRNCGKCLECCPYQAIVKLTVPCEKSCPVGAIIKSAQGRAEIDFDKCISCGRCMRSCPFGAVLERSQLVDLIRLFKDGQNVTAMVAPAIAGQFPVSLEKIFGGLKKLGFAQVMEVATGADVTSQHESEEFIERMERSDRFMTTSCCPGYIQASKKHIPEIKPFISETRTPMHYTAVLADQENPGTKTVFIGPCVAKRIEGMEDSAVDLVLTFEELGALFEAAGINLAEVPPTDLGAGASKEARRYAVSGGVAAAVLAGVNGRVSLNPIPISGLSLKNLRQLSSFAKQTCPGNLVEVMACEGGCAGGSGVLGERSKVTKAVEAFSDQTAPKPVP
ncbi:MAG: monomeric [FeFe] hydrogenase [Deltaproteobacteria bacterium]|jgi:[FeFe] hydrogenase (group B1/B3)|nr:monomeric [FeFe] hydrogenase [Deltaproteobacteria bacterium]